MLISYRSRPRKGSCWDFSKYLCFVFPALFSLAACTTNGTTAHNRLLDMPMVDVSRAVAISSPVSPGSDQNATVENFAVSSGTTDPGTTLVKNSPAALISLAACTSGLRGRLLTGRAGDMFLYANGIVTDDEAFGSAALGLASQAPSAGAYAGSRMLPVSPVNFLNSSDGKTQSLLMAAYQQAGRPFKIGGQSPVTGFDAAGFTRWLYARKGISIPGSAHAQATSGRQVVREELRPGDLLVYRDMNNIRDKYHVGIYTGQGNFLHVTSKTRIVTETAAFAPQFAPYFVSGRRYYDDPQAAPLSDSQKMAATSSAVKLALAELGPDDKLKRPKIKARKRRK